MREIIIGLQLVILACFINDKTNTIEKQNKDLIVKIDSLIKISKQNETKWKTKTN